MGKTISELILSAKSESDVRAGDIVVARVDLAFVQDTTGPLTVRQFRAAKFKNTASSLKAALFLDHAAPSQSREMSNDHILLREFAEQTGAFLSEVGDGVCHQIVAESLAKPGDLIIARIRILSWPADWRFCLRHGFFGCGNCSRFRQNLVPCPGNFFNRIIRQIQERRERQRLILYLIGKSGLMEQPIKHWNSAATAWLMSRCPSA